MHTTPSAVHARLAKHYPARLLSWVKRATWRHDPTVPLSKIDMSRRPGGRDMTKVKAIAAAVTAGKPMPPVMLVNTGAAKYAIADGYHRTLGHRHAGKRTINALIATGAGRNGPWDKAMHAAKINLSVVVDLGSVCTGPGPCDTTPFGTGNNWVNKAGGLPLYIRAIAKALQRHGHSESDAIQLAVGTVQNWAHGHGNVTAATRARAAAALAEWNRKKAQATSLSTINQEAIDLATIAHTYHWRHGWIPIDGDTHSPKHIGDRITMIPGHHGGAAHITHWNVKVDGDHVGQVQIMSGKRVMARRRLPASGDMRRISHFESPEAAARWIARSHTPRNLSSQSERVIDLAMTKGALPPLPGSDKPRFPINDHTDLKNAIRAVGRAKTGHAAIRRHIIARAKAIGGTHLLPPNWTATGNLKGSM